MPSEKNPLIPMGAVTGALSGEQIRVMLDRYAAAGIRQFMIYARDGCEVPYMSPEWLNECREIIEYAAELGMDIWLYDEFNWPSGTCGGAVMRSDEAFYAHSVSFDEGGHPTIEKTEGYADILSPDAVDRFIELTHEVYYKHFGRYFGRVIKGIFTDEPSVNYYAPIDRYPYTAGIEKEYAQATGRDLFSDMAHPTPDFDEIYQTLIGDRFRRVYVDRLEKWCREHGILLTGHLIYENELCFSVWSNGNGLQATRGFSLPGMDEILTRTAVDSAEWLTLGVLQTAIHERGNGGLAELFALGPTDLLPAREEQMIWLVALFGVDHYVLAVSAADARGNVKKFGWFNPMNYMNPWFAGYPELGAVAAQAAEWAQKTPRAEVCVRIPYTLIKRSFRRDPATGALVEKRLLTLLRLLTAHQYQWKIIGEDDPVPEGLPVLAVTAGEEEEATAEDVFKKFESAHPRKVRILDENGALPGDVLLKEYTDGSFAILDLTDAPTDRTLYYTDENRAGGIGFVLHGRGHIVVESVADLALARAYTTVGQVTPDAMILHVDRPNSLRCNIRSDAPSFSFTVREEIGEICLAIRNYQPGGQIFFDGAEVFADRATSALTPGFADLYLTTAPFRVGTGKHTVRMAAPAKSELFLPSCFVIGQFACSLENGEDVLFRLPETVGLGRLDAAGKGQILPQYAGMLRYEFRAEVPDAASLFVKLDPCEQYTRLYADGVYLGGQLRDFLWELPNTLAGRTVCFRVEQYTSIGPIFGRHEDAIDTPDPGQRAWQTDWFPYRYEKCGLLSFSFVK